MKPPRFFDDNGNLLRWNTLEDSQRKSPRERIKGKEQQNKPSAPNHSPLSIAERQQKGAETSRRLWADPVFRAKMSKLLSERAKANWRDQAYRKRVSESHKTKKRVSGPGGAGPLKVAGRW